MWVALFSLSMMFAGAQKADVLWTRNYGLRNPVGPVGGDFDYDGLTDAILSDPSGSVLLVRAVDGKVLWRRDLGREAGMGSLLPPVTGHFLGAGEPLQVVWMDRAGEVCVLSAPTGKTVCRARVFPGEGYGSVAFALAPSLLPAATRGGVDALIAVAEDRRIFKMVAVDASVVVNEWSEARIGSPGDMALLPVSVGRWPDLPNGGAAYGLAFVTVGHRLMVGYPWDHNRSPYSETIWSLGDRLTWLSFLENADGFVGEILIPDNSGKVLRFAPPRHGGEAGRLERLADWSAAGTQRAGHPMLTMDVNSDGTNDCVLTSEREVWVLDGRTGEAFSGFGRYPSVRKFVTPAAVFSSNARPSTPYLVVGDDGGHIQIVNLLRMDRPDEVTRVPVGPLTGEGFVVLDADDSGRATILVQALDAVRAIRTDIAVGQGAVPWSEWTGSALHVGGRPRRFLAERQSAYRERRAALIQSVQASREAVAKGNHVDALRLSESVLKFNPTNEEALRLRKEAISARDRVPRMLGWLVAVLVVLVSSAIGWREWAIRRAVGRAKALAAEGEAEGVMTVFRRHLRLHHPSFRLVACMAEMCDRFDRLEEEWTPLFEKWHRLRPRHQYISGILARLYLKENRTDESAAGVYELARRASDDPAPFELALGKVYAAHGHPQQARTHLEQAYRLGVREPDLFDALARVYAALDQITPRHLPVFLRASGNRPKDAELLEWLVQGYVNARLQKDPRAQKAIKSLLVLRPDSEVGNQEAAAEAYRQGDYEEAGKAARRALARNGENPTALQVLAWCLWRQRDMGAEARDIYRRAQQHHPNDSLLLRIVGQVILDDETFDEQKALHLLKAIETNPNDEEFLSAMAGAGVRWGHAPIVARALSALSRLEELNDERVLDLARAYLAVGADDAEICDVLGRAFVLEPEMPGLANCLGMILVRDGIVDPRYEDVMAGLHRGEPGRLDWALHLARIRQAQEQYEAMAQVLSDCQDAGATGTGAQRAELQRLLAEAHANLQEFAKAVDHYRSLLEVQPEDTEALVGLARAYARMGERTPEMLDTIDKAHSQAPTDPWLNFALADRAIEAGQWDKATHYFQSVLRAGGEFVDLVLNRINVLVKRLQGSRTMPARWLRVDALLCLGRYESALEETETIFALDQRELPRIARVFENILKADAKNVAALLGHGRCLHRSDHDVEARLVLEMALNLAPDNEAAKRQLAEIYESLLTKREDSGVRFALGELALDLKDYDKAVPCFQKTRLDPRLEKISTRRLAQTFFHKKMYELALQEFQNVPVDEKTMPMLYQIGREFETQNNLNGARMAYQRIYAMDAGFQDVADRINNLTQSSEVQMTVGVGGPPAKSPAEEEGPDRYELQQEIGRGAMASVYRALDRELDEIVALKVLPDSLLRNPEAVRRFRLEARSARRLTHENIVRIHDIGEEHGRKYISMEFIDGRTLKDIIRSDNQKLSVEEIVRYALHICRAMSYAHSMGIVHRDIKPANIMITSDGRVKVTDFGIAKMTESNSQTMTGAVVGTPLYMSPEQIMGRVADSRADIYSFGVVLYEMSSGSPPFHDGDLAYMHLHEAPPPLSESVPSMLREIIVKCLEKDREARWKNFDEIERRLDELSKTYGNEGTAIL